MKVLGVHIGHDSGAALVVDGAVVADVSEERFVRIKHYGGLPSQSIQACLDLGRLGVDDLDVVAVSTSRPQPELNHLFALEGPRREPLDWKRRVIETYKRRTRSALASLPLYARTFPLPRACRIVHVEHHLAHAASAYYTSGTNERQLVLTLDGVGDGVSLAVWRGESGRLTPLMKLGVEASIGWFYGNVTEALGWWHGDGEGKTMGLAPYGDHDACRGALDRFYPKFAEGRLAEPHDFGNPYVWSEAGASHWHFEEARDIADLVGRYGRENVAAEAQRVLEEQVVDIAASWLRREGVRALSCAGGVFLNVKLNQRLWYSGLVDRHHPFPNSGDSGIALGAALHAYHAENPGAPIRGLDGLWLGPEFEDEEIKRILDGRNLPLVECEDIEEEAARLLAQGRIVGWVQGRMESGPRALGARSILMSPLAAENKDVINQRVKFREGFRPFCPSLIAERAGDYLVRPRTERFMITSFDVRPDKRDAIPAVVHVDGTVRPQTVERERNERYWRVIKSFGDRTGEPVLLNTSFNVKGEPIVCHPREAIRAFYDTGLDALVLGNYILTKDGVR